MCAAIEKKFRSFFNDSRVLGISVHFCISFAAEFGVTHFKLTHKKVSHYLTSTLIWTQYIDCRAVESGVSAHRTCVVRCQMLWVYCVRSTLVDARSLAVRGQGDGHMMPGACASNVPLFFR